jgi:rhodanese-related sulfurtransferase
MTPKELLAAIDAGTAPLVLDVRSTAEFAAGHVPGAVNVPFDLIARRRSELPGQPGDELVVYCGHGPRAYVAAVAIRGLGRRRVRFLRGHWAAWRRAGLREERS